MSYFSTWITEHKPYKEAGKRILKALKDNNISHSFLKSTEDIWVKDFMPLQVTDTKFQGFRYEPSYHNKKEEFFRTKPKQCAFINDIRAKFSDINLDGGNVVGWYDKAFISERVFKDNPKMARTALIAELEKVLDCRIIFLPDPEDLTGHADGIIRWINADTVLTFDLSLGLHADWEAKMKKVLKDNGLRHINIPAYETASFKSAEGCYVNFLQLKDFMLFPVFENKGNKDDEALSTIHELFPYHKIVPININEIGIDGGLLNCCSWGVK